MLRASPSLQKGFSFEIPRVRSGPLPARSEERGAPPPVFMCYGAVGFESQKAANIVWVWGWGVVLFYFSVNHPGLFFLLLSLFLSFSLFVTGKKHMN